MRGQCNYRFAPSAAPTILAPQNGQTMRLPAKTSGGTHCKAIVIEKTEAGTSNGFGKRFSHRAIWMEARHRTRSHLHAQFTRNGPRRDRKASGGARFPMIAGSDFAGIVEQSDHPELQAGDAVIPQWLGLGETQSGRLCRRLRGSRATAWCAPAEGMTRPRPWRIRHCGYTVDAVRDGARNSTGSRPIRVRSW